MNTFKELLISKKYNDAMQFIEQCSNINMVDENENNMLCLAVQYRAPFEIVKLLIENGFNVNHKNQFQKSPLMSLWNNYFINSVTPNLNVFRLLLENGADVNVCYRNNYTTILLLINHKISVDIIELLLQYDANVLHRHSEKRNAFDEALWFGRFDIYKILWAHFLKSIWILETNYFVNLIQWLPKELVDDLVQIISLKTM